MTLTRSDIYDMVWGRIKREIKAAEDKHGTLPPDPLRRLRILTEEVGEVARELDPVSFKGHAVFSSGLIDELAQVGATVVRWLADIEPLAVLEDQRFGGKYDEDDPRSRGKR